MNFNAFKVQAQAQAAVRPMAGLFGELRLGMTARLTLTSPVQGPRACTDLLCQVLAGLVPVAGDPAQATRQRPPPPLCMADPDFSGWPLDHPEILDSLTQWLRPAGRQLFMLGLDFEITARRLPRFAHWRRDWIHRIAIRRPVDGILPAGLRLLLTEDLAAQWLPAEDQRLRVLVDRREMTILRTNFADFFQQCEPVWAVTSLGL